MIAPLVHFPLVGSLEGRNQDEWPVATTDGDVHVRPVGGRPMYIVSEATINLDTNPRFPVSLTGWTKYGTSGNSAVSHDNTMGSGSGSGSARCETLIAAEHGLTKNTTGRPAITEGLNYTFTAWVRHSSSSAMEIRADISWFGTDSGGSIVGSNTFSTHMVPVTPTTSDWVAISVTGVAPAGATHIQPRVRRAVGMVVGEVFWVSGHQIEQKDHATPFCPRYAGGVIQPGNAWTGTANSSTSTRVAGKLTIPCPVSPGSIALRYSEDGVTVHPLYTESLGQVVGSYGSIDWASGNLEITTTRSLWVDNLFAYHDVLPAPYQRRILSSIEVDRAYWHTLDLNPKRRRYVWPMHF